MEVIFIIFALGCACAFLGVLTIGKYLGWDDLIEEPAQPTETEGAPKETAPPVKADVRA